MQIAFAFTCDSKNFSEFTREQFTAGCNALSAATIPALKNKLPQLRAMLDDGDFEAIYNFVFLWACNPGKKLMELDGACSMWRRLIAGKNAWKYTEQWCEFLQTHHKRPMNLDTWRLLLPFMRVRPLFRAFRYRTATHPAVSRSVHALPCLERCGCVCRRIKTALTSLMTARPGQCSSTSLSST